MENERAPRKKWVVWTTISLAVVFLVGGVLVTREPALPFPFLSRYEIVERRTSQDGKLKILVLKADVSTVWDDVVYQQKGRRSLGAGSLPNKGGFVTEYRSLTTKEGLIKISNDLSFANQGFGVEITAQNVKPGYCAVAFTRPKTLLDQAIEWMHEVLGKSKQKPANESTNTFHV